MQKCKKKKKKRKRKKKYHVILNYTVDQISGEV